jgi:exopolysaccharide biosynthesis predicted pyruvyltransferase EpsI
MQASLAPFLQNRTTGGVALYDVALHKNLGDAVLWAAAAKLVPSFHESVKYVCAQSQFPGKGAEARKHFPKCNVKAMLKAIGPNGVVLLAPGGNWGDLWWFVHSQRLGYLKEMTEAAATSGMPFKVRTGQAGTVQRPCIVWDVFEDSLRRSHIDACLC